MGRHTTRVTITAEGRDKGKVFEITEKPADEGERWATRAGLALMNASGKLPDGVLDGFAGLEISWRNILVVGIRALQGVQEPQIRPLLEELKPCIRFAPPGGAPAQPIFPGENSQVEEIKTWYTLYLEAVQLHLGFSLADIRSTSDSNPQEPVSAS